jgi:hypothetical protein
MRQLFNFFFSILRILSFDNDRTVAIFVWNVQRCQYYNRENSQSAGARAVARAMKARAKVRAKGKKNPTRLNPSRHFFNGAGDGSNRRVRGPTRDVAPSIGQIKNLTARKCQKDLEG